MGFTYHLTDDWKAKILWLITPLSFRVSCPSLFRYFAQATSMRVTDVYNEFDVILTVHRR